MVRKILAGLLVLFALVVIFGFYKTFKTPTDLWALTGTFAGCPERPSCVSSMANDDAHHVSPFGYPGPDLSLPRGILEQIIREMPDARIVQATPEYMHVVFLTPVMRYHDDVELLVQPAIVQVRSISRFGYSDHGVNRARIEALRAAFDAKLLAGK